MKRIFILFALFLLAGCESLEDFENDYRPLPIDSQAIKEQRLGAVVASFYGNCTKIHVELQNLATQRIYQKTAWSLYGLGVGEGVKAGRTPIIMAVHPGYYRFNHVKCVKEGTGPYAITEWKEHESMSAWILPVEVGPGEVVYPGTIKEDPYEKEYGKALAVGESFLGRQRRSFKRFAIYDILDETAALKPQIAQLVPDLNSQLVIRVQESPLNKAVVKEIIDTEFATHIPTIPETDEEAEAKMKLTSEAIQSKMLVYIKECWRRALESGEATDSSTEL